MPLDTSIYNQLQPNLAGQLAGSLNEFTDRRARLSDLAQQREQQAVTQGYQNRAFQRAEEAYPAQQAEVKRQQAAKHKQELNLGVSTMLRQGATPEQVLQWGAQESQARGIDPQLTQQHLTQSFSSGKNTDELANIFEEAAYPQDVAKQRFEQRFAEKKPDEVFKIEQDKSGALFGITKSGKAIPLDINGQPLIGKEKPSFSAYQAVPMIDPDSGETIWGQFDKTHGGVAPVAGKIKNPIYNPTIQGQIASSKSTGSEVGKSTGEAITNLKDIESQMPNFENLITDLTALGKKATYTTTGQAVNFAKRELGMGVGEGAIARKEYIAKVDNEILPLLRQTFGAAFTAKEGESLKATLGAPNASPEEKEAVLRSFIATKKSQIISLERRTSDVSKSAQYERTATNPQTGQKIGLRNGQWEPIQ